MKTQLCPASGSSSDASRSLLALWTGFGAVGLALSLAACSATATGDSDAGGASEEEDCRRGEVWNGRRCVPVEDERDNGDNEDGTEVDAGPEDTLLPDGGVCEPGALECENATTVRSCNADGTEWVLEPCEEGLGCSSGQCVVGGNACEPGAVLGCASTTALRVCSSNGVDAEAQACPAETPNCRSGACTAQICEPNSLSCNGNDVVQCNSDGNATTVLETCETACGDGVCIDPCEGNGKSYVGCAFFAVDLDQFAVPCIDSFECTGGVCDGGYCSDSNARNTPFAVTVSNASASAVDVIAYNGTGAEVARSSVDPNGLTTLNLPSSTIDNSTLTSESYRIEATGPVTMHQFNPATNVGAFSNDASLLLPATAVGRDYLVMGWPMQDSDAFKTYIGIIAVEEGTTTVTISPTANLQAGAGGTPAGISAGSTGTYTLTRGQVLTLSTAVAEGLDLTGTGITADQNISVFWGSECSNVPLNVSYCDHMEEQLFPVDTWGLDFVGAKLAPRGTEADLWRILASTDNTLIRTVPAIAGVDGRRINRGEFVEFATTADFVVGASAPISVGHFMVGSSYPKNPGGTCPGAFGQRGACAIPGNLCESGSGIGDPAFLIAVPESQFRSDYIVLTPDEYQQDFLNIIAPSGAVITLDGSPIASPDARVGGWDIYRRRVEDGVHRLSGTAAFGLYAYGYDCDVSYAYPGGLNLDSL
ncbi:MAG: hypothetical protein KGO50_01040 [Myxococcales bacterium]|nr:hypothetical protein [Myxococcales bacterium]